MGSNIYIAINQAKVVNSERSMALMQETGPKMCSLTASQPGFLGYQAQYQIGVLPMAGRFGGGALRMYLDPVPVYQYTIWDREEAHIEFHRANFARVFELCAHCLPVVVEGPWEPVYRVVAGHMPAPRSLQRVVALNEHLVKPGQEKAFEQGMRALMEALAGAPGILGYMILAETGVNPWGSLMLDPASMMQMVETFGANPPDLPQPLFEPAQAAPTPPRYLIHTEWESPEHAQLGMGKLATNREVRAIHVERVLPHVVRGPHVRLFQPMLEEESWRKAL